MSMLLVTLLHEHAVSLSLGMASASDFTIDAMGAQSVSNKSCPMVAKDTNHFHATCSTCSARDFPTVSKVGSLPRPMGLLLPLSSCSTSMAKPIFRTIHVSAKSGNCAYLAARCVEIGSIESLSTKSATGLRRSKLSWDRSTSL